MPAGRGRGKPRATPLRTGPGRAGPRGGGPAGRVPGPDRNRQQKSSAARCGAEAALEGRGPPLPLSCEAGSGRRSTRIGPALHRERRGRPALSGGPHPTSRRVPATLADSRRAREDPVPQRALPAGPHPGGGRRADGPRRSPGGGRRRAHPGPGERGRRAPPDWRPAARRDRGERRSRAAGPSPRAREREPPAGRRERGPRRPAARGLRRRGPDGRGAAEQSGGPPPRRGGRRVPAPQGATWLILPVVICLSQRLSHACLSKSFPKRNCGWLIKSVMVPWSASPYMDNCGNSRANTCQQAPTLREACFY